MAKGIRMGAARKFGYGEKVFNIGELSKEDNGQLLCHYCPSDVEYVPEHKRLDCPVSSYLRLVKNKTHNEDCQFTVSGAVKALVAESQAIEDCAPIFEVQNDGAYLFRMNVLVEAQKVAETMDDLLRQGDTDLKKVYRGRNYVSNGRVLESYFRSAAGIAKIRALIQSSEDAEQLKRLVKIQYQGEEISWNDFYYEQSRYSVLSKKLESKKISYPVAIGITIKEHQCNERWKFPYCIQGYVDIKNVGGVRKIYVPRIRTKDKNLIDNFKSGLTYIVIGKTWLTHISDENNPYRNIQMAIYKKQQLVKDVGVV